MGFEITESLVIHDDGPELLADVPGGCWVRTEDAALARVDRAARRVSQRTPGSAGEPPRDVLYSGPMLTQKEQRPYDIVVFGATGFTGGLVVDYLARARPGGPLLGARRAQPGAPRGGPAARAERHGRAAPPCLRADVSDPASLRDVTSRARVLLTTVGPYAEHGEPVVAACVETGTDYVDITGEPEFVDTIRARYHEDAAAKGLRARVVLWLRQHPPRPRRVFHRDSSSRPPSRRSAAGASSARTGQASGWHVA